MDDVLIASPDGAIAQVSRKAFDRIYRPAGHVQIDLPPQSGHRAVFITPDTQGGARLRSVWPALTLPLVGVNATVWAADFGWPQLGETDVAIIHRPLSSEILKAVREYRAHGIRVIVQEDDNLYAIPPSNHFQARTEQLVLHDLAIRNADALVVTNQALVDVYGALAPRVAICPNYLPAWVSARERPRPAGPIRIGWAGYVDVHRHDLEWFAPAAKKALRGATFTTVGDVRVPEILGLEPGQFEAQRKVIEARPFYDAMARADIGIVPLEPCEFNVRGKSALKALEFVSLGRPVVVTDLPEQRALLARTGAGFMVSTAKEMAERVQELVHDDELRARMSAAALRLGRRLVLEKKIGCWKRAIEQVTGEKAAA